MASSVHFPGDRKLPFFVRDEISGCYGRKYVGCYIVSQARASAFRLDGFPPVAVYFVPTQIVSSYGDGASCKKYQVICRNASPSPPPLSLIHI